MTTPGPWLEGPEFTREWVRDLNTFDRWGLSPDARATTASYADQDWTQGDGYYVPTGDDIANLYEPLPRKPPENSGWASGSGAATSRVQSFIQWYYTGGGTFADPLYLSFLYGYHDYAPRVVPGVRAAWSPPVWPEGAIAVEYRNPLDLSDPSNSLAETLQVWLRPDTVLGGRVIDETVGGAGRNHSWTTQVAAGRPSDLSYNDDDELTSVPQATVVPGAPEQVVMSYLTSVYAEAAPGPVEVILDIELDVTEFVNDDGLITFFTVTESAPSAGALDLAATAGNRSVGCGLIMSRAAFRGRFKAPEYRFIYDSVPIRRTFPRDDGMAGGAPRTFPPSRAIQSSNRIGGGYL